MDLKLPHPIRRCLNALCHKVNQRLRRWTKPYNQSLPLNVVLDLTRSKSELVLENALLRQQLIVLQRRVKRPVLIWRDRALLVFMARKLAIWKTALMICTDDIFRPGQGWSGRTGRFQRLPSGRGFKTRGLSAALKGK